MTQKATASEMQGCIAIFDGHKPSKMAKSENRAFPIPGRKSPRMDLYGNLKRGARVRVWEHPWIASLDLKTGADFIPAD
ncbi:MAG: hypothetical protein AXA67_10310 [Methylothermaceae bacteria B42]|nr:MAG: hypothetical protein AXA67_10310 [Methylothermaceae bacteria B42]